MANIDALTLHRWSRPKESQVHRKRGVERYCKIALGHGSALVCGVTLMTIADVGSEFGIFHVES